MGISVTYNRNVIIIWTNTETKRHYLRYDTSTNTSSIVDTDYSGTVDKASSNSYWSMTKTTKMAKGTSYAANYTNNSGTWQGKFSFTVTDTLDTTSNMWNVSSTNSSITVKLKGWGFSKNAGNWPTVTIYCGDYSYSQTLDKWQNNGYTFTGLSKDTTYYIYMYFSTMGYYIGGTFIKTQADTKGWYIYNGSSWVKVTPYIYNGSRWVQCTPALYSGDWIQGS